MPFDGATFDQQDAVMDLLRRARERVSRPGGWCPGQLRRGDAVCAMGAIRSKGGRWSVIENLAVRYLDRAVPDVGVLVPGYNDAPGRTQADIVELYGGAIALCEAELQTVGKSE